MLKNILEDIDRQDKERVVAVDLDGTLAFHKKSDPYREDFIGKPIMPMVNKVKQWIKNGDDVRIFTARASNPNAIKIVKKWVKENIGYDLKVTNRKDFDVDVIYDDKAKEVMFNQGRVRGEK